MKELYDFVGLSPYRAIFLHLLLIGYPFRYGSWPLGKSHDTCRIFRAKNGCTPVELFSIEDFGVRFVIFYSLACVVWLIMRTSTNITVAFHKILLGTCICTMLALSWLQPELISGRKGPLEANFALTWTVCYSLACGLSLWTILVHPRAVTESMKWSIPANAIFCGAVMNLFVAVASFQALYEESGIEKYYQGDVSPTVRFSFAMGAVYTGIHSILLLRIRTFLTVSQLRSVCLFKLLVGLALPFVWMPEKSPMIQINQQMVLTLRVCLTFTYLFGFLWAGKAEGVSRILTSEKEG